MRKPFFDSRILHRFFVLLSVILSAGAVHAQHDTSIIRQLLREAKTTKFENKESAFQKLYYVRSLKNGLKYDKLKAAWYLELADIHQVFNQPDSCKYYGNKALELFGKLNDRKGMAAIYNCFGSNCYNTGFYTEGLANYLKSLKISLEIKDSIMVAGLYNNIGNIYDSQADKKRALEYYRKAEKFNLRLGKKSWLGINYNNIGLLLEEDGKFKEALEYLRKSYWLQKELGHDFDVALSAANMANCFSSLKQKDSAYKYYRIGWALYRQLGAPEGIARSKVNLARMFMEDHRLDSALILAKQALAEAKVIESANVKEFAHNYLSRIYEIQGDYKKAYQELSAFYNLKDSIRGTEDIAETARMEAVFKFKEDQKEDSLRHEHEKFEERVIAGQKEERQRYIRYSLLVVIILLTGFGIYVFINFRRKSKLSVALKMQKEIVEEKNKEITQSITYAKRIQHSLLPDENFLDQYFQSSFVLFRPKDIVSGDFYWFREKGEYVQIVLADCTGHGVPGAMMAVMGNTFLQEAADETQPDEPDRLLQVLDKKITTALRSKDQTTNDGMDCIVLSYHKTSTTAYIASAKRPLLLLSGEDVIEIPGSRFSIGGAPYVNKTFSLVRHPMRKNDMMYLFTDGITDQFGGEKGKKLKYANFKNTVLANQRLLMKEQLHQLSVSFEKWKGQAEQTDDVCVIGIKF